MKGPAGRSDGEAIELYSASAISATTHNDPANQVDHNTAPAADCAIVAVDFRLEGSDDRLHQTPRVRRAPRHRGSGVAGRGARASLSSARLVLRLWTLAASSKNKEWSLYTGWPPLSHTAGVIDHPMR
jgi:hypothetical protein